MSLALTPALRAALQGWADHLRGVEDRAAATEKAYQADVTAFLDFLARHRGGLATPAALGDLGPSDLRAWAAAERGGGLSARSLARRLSAVKS
ncbi:MAG: recombinase XerC, partial [Rhodobacteraceae bacterium]